MKTEPTTPSSTELEPLGRPGRTHSTEEAEDPGRPGTKTLPSIAHEVMAEDGGSEEDTVTTVPPTSGPDEGDTPNTTTSGKYAAEKREGEEGGVGPETDTDTDDHGEPAGDSQAPRLEEKKADEPGWEETPNTHASKPSTKPEPETYTTEPPPETKERGHAEETEAGSATSTKARPGEEESGPEETE